MDKESTYLVLNDIARRKGGSKLIQFEYFSNISNARVYVFRASFFVVSF